jgi:hypothetical protein
MLPLIVTFAFLGPDTLYTLSLATTELSVKSRKGRGKVGVLQSGIQESVTVSLDPTIRVQRLSIRTSQSIELNLTPVLDLFSVPKAYARAISSRTSLEDTGR